MKNQNLFIGNHRGRSRVWLDHKASLEEHGFTAGSRFDVDHGEGTITITSNTDGKRKVSANKDRPIIDLCSVAATKSLEGFTRVDVTYAAGLIIISGAAE